VVVGDDHLEAEGAGAGDLLDRGDPTVDRDDEVDPVGGQLLDRLRREPVALLELFARSKVAFILAPVTTENVGSIGAACFDAMAPGSVVVLVSRAAVVDWPALLDAASRGHIRAAIDVFPEEPIPAGEPARAGRFSRFFAPRHISVMAQIALSLMLLFSAGLFFRGALKAAGLNPGFVAAGDLVTEMDFTLVKKQPADARRLLFDIVQRARELPGVKAVGVGTMLPYGNFTNSRRVM